HHATRRTRPQASSESQRPRSKTIDRCRRMNGTDAGQPNAGPLERAFFQHAPRSRVGDARARLQRLVPQIAERVIDDGARRFGHEALAPITGAEPVAEFRSLFTRIDPANADQGALEHQDEAGFAVSQVDVRDELLSI